MGRRSHEVGRAIGRRHETGCLLMAGHHHLDARRSEVLLPGTPKTYSTPSFFEHTEFGWGVHANCMWGSSRILEATHGLPRDHNLVHSNSFHSQSQSMQRHASPANQP